MAGGEIAIALATAGDIADILALQEENQPEHGGALSARLSRQWFEDALSDMPVIVARRDGRLAGYLVASSIASQSCVPIVQTMLRTYPSDPDSYIYGPVCVSSADRGHGIPGKLFAAQRAQVGDRSCVTFIRADNAISLRAHAKLEMREVARFTHDSVALVVVAYP
jgi:predicted GNAT superfamily acetyltransferase